MSENTSSKAAGGRRPTSVRLVVELPDGSSTGSGIIVSADQIARAHYPEIPVALAIDEVAREMKKRLADLAHEGRGQL